jgi:hypothetical protein
MKAGAFLNHDKNKRCDRLKSGWPSKLRLVS